MQVSVEDLSSVKKVLRIEIPEEEVKRELDEAYRDLKKQAKVKGFRPGKTPRQVLERIYRKDINAQVSTKLIQESFADAVRQQELNLLGNPRIDPPDFEGRGPYRYEATVEIKPEIEKIDFKGIPLKKTVYPVTEEEVDTQLKMLRRKLAELKPIEEARPVQWGDFVLMDFETFKDGEPFEDIGKTENYTLEIGSGQLVPEMDDRLVGMRPGETKEIPITFPEDYSNPRLQNQEITFKVTLKEIRKSVLPPLDDTFVQNFGSYENLEDLKKDIRQNLRQGYDKRTDQELNEQVFQALMEKTAFEIPEVLVDSQVAEIVEDARRSLEYQNSSFEERGLTPEIVAEKYRDTAEAQVRRQLLLNKIIEQEGLTLTDEEVDEGLGTIAKMSGQPVDQIKAFYKANENELAHFKHGQLEKKAMDLIMEHSRIETVEAELEKDDSEQTGVTEEK